MNNTVAALVATLLLVGCTPTSPTLDMRGACDELLPILREFGEVEPDAARFADYAPRVRAVVDRSDAAARDVLEPFSEAFTGGNVWEFAGATIAVGAICSSAGSPGWD